MGVSLKENKHHLSFRWGTAQYSDIGTLFFFSKGKLGVSMSQKVSVEFEG